MLAPGIRLGPYEVVAPLGAGGMGEVYKARDTRLGREVAVKVLPGELAADPDRLRRFEQEARATAALDHPNILAVFDIGTHEGTPYIVEQLLEGESLRQRLRSGPLTPAKAVEFGVQIAQGMAAAHEKGIVHRDLKPENLFITKEGRIRILDFGLARLQLDAEGGPVQSQAATEETPTREGKVLGTPGYMAPEQVRGLAADARSDIFAFGCVLHEMLSGKRAFEGATHTDIAAAILAMDPPPLTTGVAPALAQLTRRCLEKRPEERFSTAHDLAFALEAVSSSGAAISATGPGRTVERPRGRALVAGAVAVLLLVAAALLGVRHLRHHPATSGVAPTAPSIAVLPFANLSGDKEQEYFSDGLSEELMGLLTKVKALHVAGRTSSFALKGKDISLAEIGRQLHVATVLEGSVRRSGDHLRVSVALVSATDGYQLWAETYDRTMSDVFAVQDDIAGEVVAALKVALLPEERPTSTRRRTTSLEAYAQYLLGNRLHEGNSPESWRRAVEAYENAIRLDSGYAPAYAGLAVAENDLSSLAETFSEMEEWEQKARSAAETALSLDPALASAYVARATILRAAFPPDCAGAQADFEQALALDPGDASVRTWYSWFLAYLGRLPEAIAEARKAVNLDPLSGTAWHVLGAHLVTSGDLPAAREALARAIKISPEDVTSYWYLGVASLLQKDPKAALAEFGRAVGVFRLSGVAVAEHDLGHAKESQQALDELIARNADVAAYQIGGVYAWRGEEDKALEWLDRALAQRDLGLLYVKTDPLLAKMRSDPRYKALLCKMRFPGACEGRP
jgi:serine/threonine protein kinase/tetratricopeptide (TPR) repeat protein